jgi:hypothetical protein
MSNNTHVDHHPIDVRFHPSTFVDLVQDAEEFFEHQQAFWHDDWLVSCPTVSSTGHCRRSRPSNATTQPAKSRMWTRLMNAFEQKPNKIETTVRRAIEQHRNVSIDRTEHCRMLESDDRSIPSRCTRAMTIVDDEHRTVVV